MAIDYFYDQQLRRYLLQFVRIFNQFQWQSGKDANGNAILKVIPATFASMDRQVASIIQNNSENVVLSTPQISCWIASMKRAPERIQDPNYVRTINVWERDIDPITNRYTSQLGNIYNLETIMPVPYDLTMQTDIWTSSEQQKQQILEQLLILFNPSIDLQTGNNPFDWTSLTIVSLEDITWSSRSFPAGTTDAIDIASLTFKVPIWLTAPSKLRRQNFIQQIIIDIGQVETMNQENGEGFYFSDADLLTRLIVTPGDFCVKVSGDIVTLLNPANSVLDVQGNPITWISLLQKYGKFRNAISQIRLKQAGSDLDISTNDIVGTLQLNPNNTDQLFWTVDIQTLPANTLPPITAVIDPTRSYPDGVLGVPVLGQRYLLLAGIPDGIEWGGVSAVENDIIQWNGTAWIVSFNAASYINDIEYLLNSTTGQQLLWNGGIWVLSVEGIYDPGYWRLAL